MVLDVYKRQHITSDLEHISDYISFLDQGQIRLEDERDVLQNDYGILKCGLKEMCIRDRLGADILRKEESNKTIEYLTMVPMTRKQIVCKKALVGVFYVCLLVFGLSLIHI